MTARKSYRVATRSNRQNSSGPRLRLDSKEIQGAFDPPKTSNDILCSKVVRITSNVPQSGRLSVTAAMVANSLNIPSQGVFMRFSKISVWSQQYESNSASGSDSETITVVIPGPGTAGAIPGGDGGTFSDNGTFGSRRPCVHVALPTLMAQLWVIPGAVGQPDLIAQVQADADEASGTSIVMHVTCEVRLVARLF